MHGFSVLLVVPDRSADIYWGLVETVIPLQLTQDSLARDNIWVAHLCIIALHYVLFIF